MGQCQDGGARPRYLHRSATPRPGLSGEHQPTEHFATSSNVRAAEDADMVEAILRTARMLCGFGADSGLCPRRECVTRQSIVKCLVRGGEGREKTAALLSEWGPKRNLQKGYRKIFCSIPIMERKHGLYCARRPFAAGRCDSMYYGSDCSLAPTHMLCGTGTPDGTEISADQPRSPSSSFRITIVSEAVYLFLLLVYKPHLSEAMYHRGLLLRSAALSCTLLAPSFNRHRGAPSVDCGTDSRSNSAAPTRLSRS